MKCPYCDHESTEVVETRDNDSLSVTRRSRVCSKCTKRFTAYERVETIPITVIKKNGSRESFDREKLGSGIRKAAEKTKLAHDDIEQILDEVEKELRSADSVEVESQKIGQMVAKKLKQKDKVAYIRFASVFKSFVDVEDFERELKKLL